MTSVTLSYLGTATGAQGDSSRAYQEAHERLRTAMRVPFSGDADEDFLKAMIPHQEGAVEMARVALDHAQDPSVRRLARAVIEIHTAQVALMKKWLTTPTAEAIGSADPRIHTDPVAEVAKGRSEHACQTVSMVDICLRVDGEPEWIRHRVSP